MKTRARRVTSLIAVGGAFLLGLGYHLVFALIGTIPPGSLETAYDIVTFLAFGLLLVWMSYRIDRFELTPLRVFWSAVLIGVILTGVWVLVFRLLREPQGFVYMEGLYPDSIRTALKIHVLSLIQALYAFVLVLLIRSLVLYRRSRSSLRNWYVLLGLMTLASVFALFQSPEEFLTVPAQIFMVMSVIAMVVNSFRLSWVPYLSFKQKSAIIALSLALASLLIFILVNDLSGVLVMQNAAPFARVHSFAVNVFVMLSVLFGVTYSMTTMLSLLFHLPTTGDFQKKAGELAAIHSVSRLTGKMFDLNSLIDTITASPIEAGTGECAWLALIDSRSGSLRPQLVSAQGITHERLGALIDTEAFVAEISQDKAPLLLNQAAADFRVRARPGDGIESLLVIPLATRGDILGALFVAKRVANGFERDDIDMTQTFADQVAIALLNARLFEDRLEKERMSKELEIANRVQRRLLPQTVPTIDGAEVSASSVPALEVGGDYYDFLKIGENRFGIIVGDVSGKGTSAAFYMAELKGVFQSVGRLVPSPSAFLTHANTALVQSMERSFFMSAVYAVIDTEAEQLMLARAGHPPVIVSHADGTTELIRTHGMGLGLDGGPLFSDTIREERISLAPGDSFVFYTDGIVESRGAEGTEYGYERLCRAVRNHNGCDSQTLHDAILGDLQQYIGGDSYDDDMTLVVLKWNGRTNSHKPEEGSYQS